LAFHSDSGTAVTAQRVLLTGAHGFTGRHVKTALLNAGYRVIEALGEHIDDPGSTIKPDEVALDITSLENCRNVMEAVRPDYVIHLAALSFVQHADPAAFYAVNVIGTLNLMQALADAGVEPKRVLIASSANIYGNATDGILHETQTPAPVNHYAMSKLAMEYMLKTWTERLPIVVTRPFNYTGVGQASHFLVPKIVSHFVRHASVIELGNLDVERDFSDVRFVAGVYRDLLKADCAGQTLNICSGRPYSLRAIVSMMEKIAGYAIEMRVNPAFVRQNEVKTLIGSNARLTALIGDGNLIGLPSTLQWMTDEAISPSK
jgi:nucleoside-diphosphate-sugar epimerase